MCVRLYRSFAALPPIFKAIGICSLFAIELSTDAFEMVKMGGNQVLWEQAVVIEGRQSVKN